MKAPQHGVIFPACIGVLVAPGATALKRMRFSAYSMASARVATLSPPLVSAANPE
jgi:hypothetical protein